MATGTVRLIRVLRTKPEKIYRAFIDADAMAKWLPEAVPAQLMALVDLSSQKVWLLLKEELPMVAQQRSGGRFHFYMYTDPTHKPRSTERTGTRPRVREVPHRESGA